jgi:type III restriction enzyme
VRLPNGAAAKLALYFPQTHDLHELRPVVDRALAEVGQNPAVCLVNTSDDTLTKQADIDDFNRLNDPASPHRVMLLVNKGTEGWNCPSLFACALVRRLRTSNNFVLQAATRCMRQVPGNIKKARVYLSQDNYAILDHQLEETYGETVQDLSRAAQESRHAKITLRRLNLPPLCVKQVRTHVVRKDAEIGPLHLARPLATDDALSRRIYTVSEHQTTSSPLRQVGDTVEMETEISETDAYAAAVELAAQYRLGCWPVYDELRRLYGSGDIPISHLPELAAQIEEQTRHYDTVEETVDVALALVKPDGFTRETGEGGTEVYTAEIVYPRDKQDLLLHWAQMTQAHPRDVSFHYTPYNFDSHPEASFFEQLLAHLNVTPEEVADLYFTGAITDPNKTDFFVEYKDEGGKWRRYTPDFVIRKKPRKGRPAESARVLIVEVKKAHDRQHPVDGQNGRKAMALQKWAELDPDRLKYQMIFTEADVVTADQTSTARQFIDEAET